MTVSARHRSHDIIELCAMVLSLGVELATWFHIDESINLDMSPYYRHATSTCCRAGAPFDVWLNQVCIDRVCVFGAS